MCNFEKNQILRQLRSLERYPNQAEFTESEPDQPRSAFNSFVENNPPARVLQRKMSSPSAFLHKLAHRLIFDTTGSNIYGNTTIDKFGEIYAARLFGKNNTVSVPLDGEYLTPDGQRRWKDFTDKNPEIFLFIAVVLSGTHPSVEELTEIMCGDSAEKVLRDWYATHQEKTPPPTSIVMNVTTNTTTIRMVRSMVDWFSPLLDRLVSPFQWFQLV